MSQPWSVVQDVVDRINEKVAQRKAARASRGSAGSLQDPDWFRIENQLTGKYKGNKKRAMCLSFP